jgi:hypothetical protein
LGATSVIGGFAFTAGVGRAVAGLGARCFVGALLRAGLSSRERKPCRDPDRPLRAPFCPEPLFLMTMWVPERRAGGNQAVSLPRWHFLKTSRLALRLKNALGGNRPHERETGHQSGDRKQNRSPHIAGRKGGISPLPKENGVEGEGREGREAAENSGCEKETQRLAPPLPGLERQPPGKSSHDEGPEDVHGHGPPRKRESAVTGAADIHRVPESTAETGTEEDEEKGSHPLSNYLFVSKVQHLERLMPCRDL